MTCQSAKQLKTLAKVSWAFKIVSQFGSLGYTIMEKTANLTVVQKTIIDTLHNEGKPQTFIAKKLAVHRVLYPSMLTQSLVDGKSVEEKDAKPTWENRSLMRIVKQNRFKNLGELHKEWTESGVKASRATTHRRVKEFGYICRQRRLTWTLRRRTGLLPSGPKSSFPMRASFVFHLETKVLESGGRMEKLITQVSWSPVLSFHSLWGFGVQCHLLVLVHCVFWKPTSLHPFTKKFCSTSCFLLLTSFLKLCWFHVPAGFGTCPHCQKHQKLVKWPWCWCAWLASKLTRPEPHRESVGYCQEENEKQETKKCRWAEGHCQRNLGFYTTSAVPQTDHTHATLNWDSN